MTNALLKESRLPLKKIECFISLARLNRPIGIILLALPCWWGIALTTPWYHLSFYKDFVLFSIGAIALRSAGCIINDCIDQTIDRHVARTKTRPLASQSVSSKEAYSLFIGFCSLGLFIFFWLSSLAKVIALIGFIFMLIYPWIKRITYGVQVFLGLTFGIGVLVAYAQHPYQPVWKVLVLYSICILWIIAYDTIYAFQDIIDDQKLGLKSTAVLFQKTPKLFIGACYGGVMLLIQSFLITLPLTAHILLNSLLISWMGYILRSWTVHDPKSCLHAFKKNQGIGWIILGILIFYQ